MTHYQFVDDSGETRLAGTLDPEPAGTFNGGTITSELTIDTGSTTDQALELTGTRTTENNVLAVDYPHTSFVVDSDGLAVFASDDHMGVSIKGIADSGAGLSVYNDPSQDGVNLGSFGLNYKTSSAEVVNVDSAGFRINFHAAPADGDLVAGEMAIWFDQTDGAAKLMIKAKTADGTVATGSVALA